MIVDHDNHRVLEVLENREKATVKAYLLKARDEGLLAGVVEVTVDMWDAYAGAAREVFPAAAVTVDRFHVMKNFQEGLSGARRELQKGLSAEERKLLKGSRWLWSTNPENLSPEKRAELEALQARFPELARISERRESLRAIFEDKAIADPAEGRRRLQEWMEKTRELGIKALERFLGTLGNWMEGISNYFRSRSSNGRTEGFNRGIRAILGRTFGMTSFANFRLRVLHAFGRTTQPS